MTNLEIFYTQRDELFNTIDAEYTEYNNRLKFIASLTQKYQKVVDGNTIDKNDHVAIIELVKLYYYILTACNGKNDKFESAFPIDFCTIIDQYSYSDIKTIFTAYSGQFITNNASINLLPEGMKKVIQQLMAVFEKDNQYNDEYILRMSSAFQSFYICSANNSLRSFFSNGDAGSQNLIANAKENISLVCQSCQLLTKKYQEYLNNYLMWKKESTALLSAIEDAIIQNKPFKFTKQDAETLSYEFSIEIYKILLNIQGSTYNNSISNNNDLNTVLLRYGICPNEIMISSLSHVSIDHINEILEELNLAGFDIKKLDIISIILNSSISIISDIMRLVQKGILSKETIYEYSDVFISGKDGLFDQLITNYQLIKPFVKSPISRLYQEALINTSSNLISANMASSQYYANLFNNSNPLLFILNPSINLIADYLIENSELGTTLCLDNLMGSNLVLVLQRIIIAREVGIDIIVSDKIADSIVTGNKFIVPDNLLDQYFTAPIDTKIESNPDVQDNELIQYLNSVYLTNNIYNFNGVIVSRVRLMRNLSQVSKIDIESLYNAILKNNFYSTEELEKISIAIHSMIK